MRAGYFRECLIALLLATTPSFALVFTIPSNPLNPGTTTLTYSSEASDPAGNMTFWYGHTSGAGGYFVAAQNVAPTTVGQTASMSVDIFDTAVDTDQWNFAAGPIENRPDELFSFSKAFGIVAAANSSSSTGNSSAIQTTTSASTSATSTSASDTSTSPVSDTLGGAGSGGSATSPGNAAESTVGGTGALKSSNPPPAAAIAGGVIGGIALLFLLTLCIMRLRRSARRRQLDRDLEKFPVDLNDEESANTYPTPFTSKNASGYGYGGSKVSMASSNPYASASAQPAPLSKAATQRQEYLTNQLSAVQAQLRALTQSGGAPTASYPSASSAYSYSGSSVSGSGNDRRLREQNAALHERIRALEGQLQSQWALGLSDEAPPGYLE